MSKKLTIEEIKNRIKDKPVKLLSTKYLTSDKPLQWKHTTCGHVFPRSWTKIKQTHKCPICTGQEKVTINVVKRRLKERDIKLQVLSTTCNGAKDVLDWQCEAKGHIFSNTPDGIFSQNKIKIKGVVTYGCSQCALENRPTTSIPDIKNRIMNKNIELVSTEVPNCKAYVTWKCKEHDYTFTMTPDNVYTQDYFYCPYCTLNEIRKELELTKRPIILLSTEYTGNGGDDLYWECTNKHCGHKWYASRNKVMNKTTQSGCPECGRKSHNITNAKRNEQAWKATKGIVYIIRCYDEHESFYKIGITIRRLKIRMKKVPYNYEVIKIIETTRYASVFIEADLHTKHNQYRYTPNKKFGGYRECFSKLHIKE